MSDDTYPADTETAADSPIWTERRDRILLSALPNVAFDGWTEAAMLDAARDAGFAPEVALLDFPGGPIDLVTHFSDWADRQMLDRMQAANLPSLKVRDKIALGVRSRLEVLAPHKEAARRAFSLLALPHHAGRAAKLLWRSCDAIWWAAGDTATDFNHYSKRTLLAGVLASTTLYWQEDTSEGHAESWAFLDRRISNALSLGGVASKLAKAAPNLGFLGKCLPSPSFFARAMGRK